MKFALNMNFGIIVSAVIEKKFFKSLTYDV